MAKESVSARMADEGISYTEFSYQILQALDYLELYRRYGTTLQTGGSDQWGNLTAGVDLIRRVEGASVHALATPLITRSDGTKYGKTEAGALWLDPSLTSPYAFYQYFLNTADADVGPLLRVFSFRSRSRDRGAGTGHHGAPGGAARTAGPGRGADRPCCTAPTQARAVIAASTGHLRPRRAAASWTRPRVAAVAAAVPHRGGRGAAVASRTCWWRAAWPAAAPTHAARSRTAAPT